MSDDEPLYKINVRQAASPGELKAFCDMLEKHNYDVATDLSNGRVKVRQAGDRSE